MRMKPSSSAILRRRELSTMSRLWGSNPIKSQGKMRLLSIAVVILICITIASTPVGVDSSDAVAAKEVQVNLDGSCTTTLVADSDEAIDDDDKLFALNFSNESDLDFGEDLGLPQDYDDEHNLHEIQAKLHEARSYLATQISEKYHELLRDHCRNQHVSCAYWAVMGECDKNAAYMNVTCAPVCLACESLLLELRCPLDPDAVDIWHQPGDLNRMFERITTHPDFGKYEPRILSRPSLLLPSSGDTTIQTESPAAGAPAAVSSSSYQIGPWLITLDKFLLPDEADRLIELSQREGYQRSTRASGTTDWDGTILTYVDDNRTSSSVYCQSVCSNDTTTRAVIQRLEEVTDIPESHYQHLQFIRYETGQLFAVHHDYFPHQRQRQQGVRLFIIFIYFNDVEEGGGTNFPLLNLTITPKKGRAVIWPQVKDEDPHSRDDRMFHQALPVIRGIKYASNTHVHQHDYKTPHANRCS